MLRAKITVPTLPVAAATGKGSVGVRPPEQTIYRGGRSDRKASGQVVEPNPVRRVSGRCAYVLH
jgi:hypothetical protein